MKRNTEYLIGNQYAKGNAANQTSFKKGLVPWNKDSKGLTGENKTSFKKGQAPPNILPIGSIQGRTTKRNGRTRNFIKVGKEYPSQNLGWTEYAKYLWIERYGNLLNGDVVHHLNGVSTDDRIENLIALPRSEHPKFHNKHWIHEIPNDTLQKFQARY